MALKESRRGVPVAPTLLYDEDVNLRIWLQGFPVPCDGTRAGVLLVEENEDRSYLAEVDAIARTVVNFQFHDAFTDGLTVAKIPQLYPRQPGIDTGLGFAIPQCGEPLSKRRFPPAVTLYATHCAFAVISAMTGIHDMKLLDGQFYDGG